MIRIAFVIDSIESPSAGTEKQLLLTIRHLDRGRFLPYLCVLRGSAWLRESFSDCEVVEIGMASFATPSGYLAILNFARFLKEKRIDAVQTQFTDGNKVGLMAAKLAGVRTVISTRRNQGYWHTRGETLLLRLLDRWPSCFLANSDDTARWLAATEKVDPARIRVLHNAIDTDAFAPAPEPERLAFRAGLGLAPDAKLVGIVANLRPVKAVDVFVRAAAAAASRSPGARFLIIGEGHERESLERLCAELGVSPAVRFLGSRLDVPAILGCLDLGVLTSSSESFSNSIVEYMAAGLPVVCTDVGGAREAIETGVNGFVVAPGDVSGLAESMLRVLEGGDAARIGAANRDKARRMFSVPTVMERYQEFLEQEATP